MQLIIKASLLFFLFLLNSMAFSVADLKHHLAVTEFGRDMMIPSQLSPGVPLFLILEGLICYVML